MDQPGVHETLPDITYNCSEESVPNGWMCVNL